ncbi:nck-associated protein 5 isoform X3 [Podarcis raffonei]|uniref:nck-associated protein 5 isoform X3 n=1 Tax=Podarcis raffonei TaxID=65483 RepID=UPI0023296F98|nr:nck-associated protein 5 isoform X3 [Podarcis raffonei]
MHAREEAGLRAGAWWVPQLHVHGERGQVHGGEACCVRRRQRGRQLLRFAREKLSVARLQQEVARSKSDRTMREKLIHELEEERHLRLESEKKLREVTLESERNRVQMRGLQQQFSRMEETVRNLLQRQGSPEANSEKPVTVIKAYQETFTHESKSPKTAVEDICMSLDKDSRDENSSAEEEKEKTKLLLERLKALEAENSALAMENENQREQYERCLDEVANQVVQALLTQKDLREECLKLKTRVFDLEQQNRTLSVLFHQRMKPTSGLLLQECQQNIRSGVPALKCQSQLNMTGPHRVYPRSSCSSSELSLSSACSEYSSGSSYTWNDGKACSKRSSVNWDKRISIGSSLPSNLSSPADDLPPTRIKENHILEGLKKLQKCKILLEPPSSVISKWGYKDCMDSNEGIYSPGIKCSSHKEEVHCTPEEMGAICIDHQKNFVYDSDSHEDADDESSSLALLYEVPSKDCRHYCNKLTHSVSDSLFGWEPDRKHLPERGSYFNSKERPEKLTSFVNEFQSKGKSCTNVKLPVLQIDKSLASISWRDLNLHLSDTDDNEILDELHIESSDEKSPSDLSLTPFVDKHTENSDVRVKKENCQHVSSEKEASQALTHSGIRPKACNFIKQQKVIKKTSSEECITVIFDAEDGKPIEFSSHQSGVVTVTRNEISINHSCTGPNAEYTECLPQGIVNFQKAMEAKNYSILQAPDNEIERKTLPNNLENEHAVDPTTCNSQSPLIPKRPMFHNIPQQKLMKPVCSISSKPRSPSCMQAGSNQNQKLTKIPSRDKFSPQKTNITVNEYSTSTSSHCPMTLEKSVKCSRFKKVQSPTKNTDSKVDLLISRVHPLQNSKMLDRTDWPKNQVPESTSLPQHLIESIDCEEPPTRDIHCDLPAVEARSPSPPPPPGRSTSLLIRPNYEYSPPVPYKPGASIPSETVKSPVMSPLKTASMSIFHNVHRMSTSKLPSTPKVKLNNFNEKGEVFTQSKCISEQPSTMCQVIPKVFTKKVPPKTSNQSVSCNNIERNSKDVSPDCTSQDTDLMQNELLPKDTEVPQKNKFPNRFSTSPDCQPAMIGKPFLPQINHSPLSLLSQGSDAGNIPEKSLKPHLPVGLKLLIKSPQLLRKSSTIPGKQEKDSMNAASKSCVNSSKRRQGESLAQTTIDVADTELRNAENGIKESFAGDLGMNPASSISPETCCLVERGDGLENRLVKRSISSSSKAYLKPALGMNGAKARSQSFSIHTGEKSPIPSTEGLGKVRTQIITNTSERGNSLTRQNSAVEGLQVRAVPGSAVMSDTVSNTTKVPETSYSRQGSSASMSSSSSQVGSPSKLPFHMSPKGDLFCSISKTEDNKSPSQRDVQSKSFHDEKASEISKHQPVSKKSVTQAEMALESSTSISSEQILPLQKNLDSTQSPHKHEAGKVVLQEACIKASEALEKVSASSVLQPTIEEKVMLCIQENMQKEQGQSKCPTTETKQKSGGPSIASWFGFRKSKLPALSGRKADISKVKIEKKEPKGLAFGSKQTKSEKRKDKKKTEQHCEAENEINKKTLNCGILDSVPKGKKMTKATHNNLSQTGCEQKNSSATTHSGKDSFMKELLHRVDKKAAQPTESGSHNVSYRSVSKGGSQGSSLPNNSVGTQGNQKKTSKTKADMEIPNDAVIKVVTENFQEDEENAIADSTCQSHLIESCCQMRTLDSGIGTFPLPDSGNRSTGRHVSKQELDLEADVFISPAQGFPPASSEKAKTLEREVPSTANKDQGSVESIITHSTSDPAMTAKGVQTFQSHLPKPASAGIMSPVKKSGQEESSLTSVSLKHSEKEKCGNKMFPDWSSKKAIKAKDRALRVCTYSASSSSDTETELEYETNDFGTGGEKLVDLMKNNKQAEQEENSVRKSFMGRPMSILDIYQHSLCGHYGEDGPEQLAHYSFIEQLNGTSTKDGKSKKIPSKLKQPEEAKEDSEKGLSKISLESLNKFNSSRSILLEKESKVEGQEEENGKNEEVSLNSSDRHDIDHLESLSDSLYDSFSSCASQGSNDV